MQPPLPETQNQLLAPLLQQKQRLLVAVQHNLELAAIRTGTWSLIILVGLAIRTGTRSLIILVGLASGLNSHVGATFYQGCEVKFYC